ncbi:MULTISPECIES: cytidylyltransferase domain-containing protein [unclassified Knoellia]|uniref:cytidylyltransferase domain-containing protein n=1 Tax=Knoellia altitudinis TaxID=3404795 RepID=UPI0036155646
MRRTRVVIQSRLNSSRLPGKAMLTVGGLPLIELVARRASRGGHEVVVATSVEDYDGLIAEHLESVGISVVRGSLDDVLGRFVVACEGLTDDDFVVRLTGDNPVADADLVDELIESTVASGHGYGRVDMEAVPEGLGAEVFTAGALREAAAKAVDAYDREHVTPWLIRTFGQHSFAPVDAPTDIHAFRATVDSLSDYVRVSRLFDRTQDAVSVPWRTVMEALRRDVESRGALVPRKDASLGGQSCLVLSARTFATGGADGQSRSQRAADLRSLLARAVELGVSHVDVASSDTGAAEALVGATEPALTRRLRTILHVDAEAGQFPYAVERAFAALGRRSVACLVVPSSGALADVWQVAREYAAAGTVHRIGLVVTTPGELAAAVELPDLGYLEVRGGGGAAWAREHDDALTRLAETGVVVSVALGDAAEATALDLKAVLRPPWATSLVIACDDQEQLVSVIAALT